MKAGNQSSRNHNVKSWKSLIGGVYTEPRETAFVPVIAKKDTWSVKCSIPQITDRIIWGTGAPGFGKCDGSIFFEKFPKLGFGLTMKLKHVSPLCLGQLQVISGVPAWPGTNDC